MNEPVLICTDDDTVPIGNPEGYTYDDVVAYDAVDGTKVILVAADAVVANEELITFCAHELVPNNEPV